MSQELMSRMHAVLGLGLVAGGRGATVLAVLCAALTGCGPAPAPPRKVVVVGIDGAEWTVLEQLRAAGRVPTLDRLASDGARGPLGSLQPTRSPALWTTVATGMPASRHGIENFVLFRPQAEFPLPPLPSGALELRLDVEVLPPCTRDLLEIYLNRVRLGGGTWDDEGLAIQLPEELRGREPDVVTLRLPPRCAPPTTKEPSPGGDRSRAAPWGTLARVAVLGTKGEPLTAVTGDAIARGGKGLRPGGDGEARMLLTGRPLSQIESGDREVPALWNIASARGRTVGVVGWWCTWPAERVRGTMVSDALFFASTRRLLGLERLPEGVFQAGAAYPPEAGRLLVEYLPAEWTLSAEELAHFVPNTSSRFPDHLRVPARVGSLADPPLVILKDTYLLNRPYFSVARRLAAARQPDLLLVYTNLVDAVEHKFWRYHEPERFSGVRPEELEDFGDTVARTYVFVDAELGVLLSAVGPDTVVLVISDHGHHAASDGGSFSGAHADAPPGVLIAAGPGVRRGAEITGATLYDVAPTVLAVLGLPVAADMPGRVLEELFTSAPSVERVETYADLPREAAEAIAAPAVDASVRERLRALGYLE